MSKGAPDFDHMIYVRLIEACNLHCQHCFIPNNPKRMDWNNIEQIPAKVRSFARPGQVLLFQLHGGEPTLVGQEFMRKSVVFLKTELSEFDVRFSLQTNLMTFDLRWAEIYHEFFDGIVGVSWDPEIRLIRAGRPESNEQFENKFWANIQALQSLQLTPYMVITVTQPLINRFRNPTDLIDFLLERGISLAHFERLTRTGYAITNWDWLGVTNREYSMWIGRFAMAYSRFMTQQREGRQELNISPLDGLIASVERLRRGERGGYGCLSGACDTRFHTFDQNGYYSACTALTSERDNRNAVGVTVVEHTQLETAREERQMDCSTCQFKPICSSGCMATPRMDESQECAGGYMTFRLLNDHIATRDNPGLIAIAG
ncbi:radical SAM protein [Pseudomonas putida]|uniref:radical SAM protein n=1 Tax=Pseudomonas putida TaxID=303 RepID=UPI00125D4190|nr:radical SAM protein [Pseudomonas putida]